MRLLNVTTMQVEEFYSPNIPPYAILSHTWGADEMTLADMETIARHRLTRQQQMARILPRTPDKADTMKMLLLSSMLMAFRGGSGARPPTPPSIADSLGALGGLGGMGSAAFEKALVPASLHSSHILELKAGFAKVTYACGQASREGYQYIWIDTCCIDKTSTAEVSEALNCMFAWYQSAGVCYAYLEDVQHGGHRGGYRVWKDDFAESRWFKRGWTLQELLAPKKVLFFGKGWKQLGTKASLVRTIEKATGIDRRTLLEPALIPKASVARRMSWAADRATTRPEDTAYCLMAIFGVKMMPLYGEGGENAFLRLQRNIIERTDDQTLFAWGILGQEERPVHHHTQLEEFSESDSSAMSGTMPVLARSPHDFAGMSLVQPAAPNLKIPSSRDTPVESANSSSPNQQDTDYNLTNKGLRIALRMLQIGYTSSSSSSSSSHKQKIYIAALDCRHEQEDPQDRLGILLAETETPGVYIRTRTRKHTRVSGEDLDTEEASIPKRIYISNSDTSNQFILSSSEEEEKLFIRAQDLISPGYDIVDIKAKQSLWNREFGTMRLAGMASVPEHTNKGGKVTTGPGVVYQLAVLMFWNRHLKSGFVARILVDTASGEGYVDLAPPPPKPKNLTKEQEEDEDEALNRVRAETRRYWENPGRVNLMRTRRVSPTKTVTMMQAVDVVNPELVGGDEEEELQSRPGSAKPRGEAVDLRSQVLFEEIWEKEYHRLVNATITRKKKGVMALELSAMLFEGA